MFKKFKDFVRMITSLRQAATLPDGERSKTVVLARAGLSEWNAEVMIPRMLKELESESVSTHRSTISALRAAGLDALGAVPALMAFFDRMENPRNSDEENYARKEASYAMEEIMRKAQNLVEQEEYQARQRDEKEERLQRNLSATEQKLQSAQEQLAAIEARLGSLRKVEADAIARRREREANEIARLQAIDATDEQVLLWENEGLGRKKDWGDDELDD